MIKNKTYIWYEGAIIACELTKIVQYAYPVVPYYPVYAAALSNGKMELVCMYLFISSIFVLLNNWSRQAFQLEWVMILITFLYKYTSVYIYTLQQSPHTLKQ